MLTKTEPPKPTDYLACLSWRNLHLRLNENASKKLRDLMGVTKNFLDPSEEEKARRSPNPLVRQAFQKWQESEREFDAATQLLEIATELKTNQRLNAIHRNLDC